VLADEGGDVKASLINPSSGQDEVTEREFTRGDCVRYPNMQSECKEEKSV
jgi:hypothetical protein